MGYAGKHRYFTYASWLLAVISALIALLPFVYAYRSFCETKATRLNLFKLKKLNNTVGKEVPLYFFSDISL